MLLKDKDLVILNIQKDQSDSEVVNLRKQLLQEKGIMSSRGIAEFYFEQCFQELGRLGLVKIDKKWTMNDKIGIIMSYKEKCPENAFSTRKLHDQLEKCNCEELIGLYSELSHEIHGRPWSGESVKVMAEYLSRKYYCMIEFFASELKLSVDKIGEAKTND